MPTVAELERLQALVGQLTPISGIHTGELIRADDWNKVVGALIEMIRAVLASESDGVVEAHEHPDQVSAGWLEPRLRSLVERGGLADPAGVARINDLERRLQRQTERLEGLIGTQDDQRSRLSDLSTSDLSRQASVTQLQRTVEGMVDGREEVTDLRATLSTLDENVKLAIEASQRFTVDGQPVDMQAFNDRLQQAEELRQRLTSPDGSLLDAAALEIRLTELTNTLVTEEELNEALKQIKPVLTDNDRGVIQANVATMLENDLAGAKNELAADVMLKLDEALAMVDPKVSDAVAGAISQVISDFDQKLSQFAADLTAVTDKKIADINTTMLDTISKEVGTQVSKLSKSLRLEISKHNDRLDVLEKQMGDHENRILRLEKRVFG